jgi:hypothetical protein
MRLLHTLLGLLVWTSAAHADGSWIRWAEVTTGDGRIVEWKVLEAYPNQEACERELSAKRVETFAPGFWWHKCLPDTIDPRGTKGK